MLYRLVSFLVKLNLCKSIAIYVNHVNVIKIYFLKMLFPVIIFCMKHTLILIYSNCLKTKLLIMIERLLVNKIRSKEYTFHTY
jgi:hypothetical protein